MCELTVITIILFFFKFSTCRFYNNIFLLSILLIQKAEIDIAHRLRVQKGNIMGIHYASSTSPVIVPYTETSCCDLTPEDLHVVHVSAVYDDQLTTGHKVSGLSKMRRTLAIKANLKTG